MSSGYGDAHGASVPSSAPTDEPSFMLARDHYALEERMALGDVLGSELCMSDSVIERLALQ
jgi:hypothetical protein